MKSYVKHGHKDFIIALGYKGGVIRKYFKNEVDKKFLSKIKVKFINTGIKTMTGGRLKRLEKYLANETFFLTYGDGLSDVNINNLLLAHKKRKNYVTVTAVRPVARFGEIVLRKNKVISFKEKPQVKIGWINGGYFVMEGKIFNYIKDDKTDLEKEPLEKICNKGKLYAFKHEGFWQCMDTKREKDLLENIFKNKIRPWL